MPRTFCWRCHSLLPRKMMSNACNLSRKAAITTRSVLWRCAVNQSLRLRIRVPADSLLTCRFPAISTAFRPSREELEKHRSHTMFPLLVNSPARQRPFTAIKFQGDRSPVSSTEA
jgi:hypothetical protein